MTTRIPQVEIEPWRTLDNGLNEQAIYRFNNGYGASVIIGPYTYGGDQDLWELAVLRFEDDGEEYRLTYVTPITDDVLGYLTNEDVAVRLAEIAALPSPMASKA